MFISYSQRMGHKSGIYVKYSIGKEIRRNKLQNKVCLKYKKIISFSILFWVYLLMALREVKRYWNRSPICSKEGLNLRRQPISLDFEAEAYPLSSRRSRFLYPMGNLIVDKIISTLVFSVIINFSSINYCKKSKVK